VGGSKFSSSSPSTIMSDLPSSQPSVSPSIVCVNEENWYFNLLPVPLGCFAIETDPVQFCQTIGDKGTTYCGKNIYEACCSCGGGQHVEPGSICKDDSTWRSGGGDDPLYSDIKCSDFSDPNVCLILEDYPSSATDTEPSKAVGDACCLCRPP